MKTWQKVLIGAGLFVAANAVYAAYRIQKGSGKTHPGNAQCYFPENGEPNPDSPLQGKQIIFLGSSVTFGSAALGHSFAEYLTAWDGVRPVKEAVSGTLLVEQASFAGQESYITRMRRLDSSLKPDCLLCQLSTNDATMKKPLGEISDDGNFDTLTVTGAIEYIIDYARKTWNCPVVFYTGTRYDSERYEAMVERLLELQKKWDIGVIDLWHDEEMNAVSTADYKLYMNDPIHPTMAGYSRWWLPKFRAFLYSYLN